MKKNKIEIIDTECIKLLSEWTSNPNLFEERKLRYLVHFFNRSTYKNFEGLPNLKEFLDSVKKKKEVVKKAKISVEDEEVLYDHLSKKFEKSELEEIEMICERGISIKDAIAEWILEKHYNSLIKETKS